MSFAKPRPTSSESVTGTYGKVRFSISSEIVGRAGSEVPTTHADSASPCAGEQLSVGHFQHDRTNRCDPNSRTLPAEVESTEEENTL